MEFLQWVFQPHSGGKDIESYYKICDCDKGLGNLNLSFAIHVIILNPKGIYMTKHSGEKMHINLVTYHVNFRLMSIAKISL